MRYEYRIKADIIRDEQDTEHEVYGIAAYDTDTNTPIRIIGDIFCEREAAEWFISLCNRLELSVEQLDEAVEDVICA